MTPLDTFPPPDPTNPNPKHYSRLDDFITPLSRKNLLTNFRSLTSVPFESRHFPIIATLTPHDATPTPKPATVQRFYPPTLKEKQEFRLTLTQILNSLNKTNDKNNIITSPLTSTIFLEAYTDGSSPENAKLTLNSPAGWGYCFKRNDDTLWTDGFGPVCSDPLLPAYAGSQYPSNNSAELQALLELFDYFLRHPPSLPVLVYIDSSLTLDSVLGDSNPTVHPLLISNLRNHFSHLSKAHSIRLIKIKGHSDNEGNDRADQLAEQGSDYQCRIGRYAQDPPFPIFESLLSFPQPWFKELSLNAQYKHLADSLQQAATETFTSIPPQQRKPYIAPETWQKILRLQSLPPSHKLIKPLQKAIKRSAKKDKLFDIANRLLSDSKGSAKDKWQTIRSLKKPFSPKPASLKDKEGITRPIEDRINILAQHYRDVWSTPLPLPLPTSLICEDPAPIPLGPFTLEELRKAIARLTVGKSPGPDQVRTDWIKWSSHEFQLLLLQHFNSCFLSSSSPEAWSYSYVIPIYKGAPKDISSPESYRPISLCQTLYKLYASILQRRLAIGLEDRLRPTQYGSRQKRSTSQPLTILRRLIDIYERHNDPLYILLLDWSKAFDSISHESISNSLLRLGAPESIVQAILSLYQNLTFSVKENSAISDPLQQL
jgi:ribonuclease HI